MADRRSIYIKLPVQHSSKDGANSSVEFNLWSQLPLVFWDQLCGDKGASSHCSCTEKLGLHMKLLVVCSSQTEILASSAPVPFETNRSTRECNGDFTAG